VEGEIRSPRSRLLVLCAERVRHAIRKVEEDAGGNVGKEKEDDEELHECHEVDTCWKLGLEGLC